MKCSIKKRELPPLPKVTTKQVHDNHIFGYGKHTYEYNESGPGVDLYIPPTRSDSQAAQSEREMKIILDLARQGKTATQIAEESGYNRNRVIQVVKRFAEHGAKLAPEPKKPVKSSRIRNKLGWSTEQDETLIRMYNEGAVYVDISQTIGKSVSAVSMRIQKLHDAGKINHRKGRRCKR